MAKRVYDTADVLDLAGDMRTAIIQHFAGLRETTIRVYAVPRGGIPARLALLALDGDEVFTVCDDPAQAHVIVDDLIDTGETQKRYAHLGLPFFALIDKRTWEYGNDWVVWPWEGDSVGGIEDNIRRLIQYAGDDPSREGMHETPARVAKAWQHWCGGYDVDPASLLKTFEDGAEGAKEMVLMRNIPFFSHCVIGSTFVETPRGRIPISRLKDGDWIYTMDPVTFDLQITRCVNPRITQRSAELVQVHTDNDSLICTPDHRILLTTGEWREAQHLQNGDRLASLYRGASTWRDSGNVNYPTLISSRYTRHARGIMLHGESRQMVEHRFVSEFFNGPLPSGRSIVHHHIDEKVWHNNPENIERLTHADHNRRHERTQKLANNQVRKDAAAAASGREEVRAKRSESVKAYWARLRENPEAYDAQRKAMSAGIEAAGRNHVVFGVERLDYMEDVWCMTVPDTQLFFANGIAVHNCEHHMAPFFGTATVGYIPNGRIVGLSKLNRLVDCFARRFQVQERMTAQIADAIAEHLAPLGVGVIVTARHMCIESRGIQQHGSETTTSALRGVMIDGVQRQEFLMLAR